MHSPFTPTAICITYVNELFNSAVCALFTTKTLDTKSWLNVKSDMFLHFPLLCIGRYIVSATITSMRLACCIACSATSSAILHFNEKSPKQHSVAVIEDLCILGEERNAYFKNYANKKSIWIKSKVFTSIFISELFFIYDRWQLDGAQIKMINNFKLC